MDEAEIKTIAERVVNQERCKHGMVWEWCGECQKVEYSELVKFPITVFDEETGKDKVIWLETEAQRVAYRKYRKSNGFKLKRKGTKPHINGFKVKTVDSAIGVDPFYKRR